MSIIVHNFLEATSEMARYIVYSVAIYIDSFMSKVYYEYKADDGFYPLS